MGWPFASRLGGCMNTVIARSPERATKQSRFGASDLDCFAELVIGPATSGRTRWLAMTDRNALTRHIPGFSQLTIQGVPKRSISMPKRCAQNVSWIGILTVPFSDSALKMRSASAGASTLSVTTMPCIGW